MRGIIPLARAGGESAFALIFVPSSVTRSSVIKPSALSIPSTGTNKLSNPAFSWERKSDSV